MSREAIAAALARDDLSCGERLVAFSLASFADRDNRARPGTPAGAGRAGLARSQFLEARDRIVRRGLVVVQDAASGRGRASTLWLTFAGTGPWWEGEINAELFEAVLGYSHSRGPARLLLAALAALADEHSVVVGVTTERLCAAAGVADRTYRRARARLLASGEVVLRGGSGGRGNTNCWEIQDPRSGLASVASARGRRVPPPSGLRPLMATVAVPVAVPVAGDGLHRETVPAELPAGARGHAAAGAKGGQDRTVSTPKGPVLTGVSEAKGGHDRTLPEQNRPALTGVSAVKGGPDRTLSRETPAKTPAETPAPNARAGREPQDPRTTDPPSPPEGGYTDVGITSLMPSGRLCRVEVRLTTISLLSAISCLELLGIIGHVAAGLGNHDLRVTDARQAVPNRRALRWALAVIALPGGRLRPKLLAHCPSRHRHRSRDNQPKPDRGRCVNAGGYAE